MSEGYARKIVAGLVSPPHDRPAVLQLLSAALAAYGCPQALVSDTGGVLPAKESLAMLRDFDSAPRHIAPGKPWQHLLAAQCKVP